MNGTARVVLLMGACLGASVCAQAVKDPTQGIPPDVVWLLMRIGMNGTDTVLRPGGPGTDFPSGLFPIGTVLNATMTSPTGRTTVIGTAATLDYTTASRHVRSLLDGGWISNTPQIRGLFVPNPMAPFDLCNGTDFVSIAFFAREAGGLHIRATNTKDPRVRCGARSGNGFTDIEVPRLTPLLDGKNVGSEGPAGGFTSSMRLETTLPVRTVLEHYEQQLMAAGWKVAGHVGDDNTMASTRFDVPSNMAQSATGWLTATSLPGGDVDVFLRLVRNARDPSRILTVSPSAR